MKKTAFIAALFLTCASLSHATTGGSTKQPAPADGKTAPAADKAAASAPKAAATKTKKKNAAEAALIEKYVSLQDAAIATFLELGDTLQGVKDKSSADAAAPTVKMAGEQLYTIIRAVESLGEPSEAAQQAIASRIANVAEKNRIAEQVMMPMLNLMMLEPPCHGSESLQTELTNLLANLQGAAGIEEEEVEAAEDAVILKEPQ